MKTALFSSCYLNGFDGLGNDRVVRTLRYVEYYMAIKNDLGFNRIEFLDNGSQLERQELFLNLFDHDEVEFTSLDNIAHDDRYEFNYPHCWRALYYIRRLIEYGYEKIIVIDTDGFVVSQRLAHHIRDMKSGWNTFHCPRWDFPDASIQVLCKDAFPTFLKFTKGGYNEHLGKCLETTLPFTHVERGFKCDRFGEIAAPLTSDMDYYGQAGPHIKLKYFTHSEKEAQK